MGQPEAVIQLENGLNVMRTLLKRRRDRDGMIRIGNVRYSVERLEALIRSVSIIEENIRVEHFPPVEPL